MDYGCPALECSSGCRRGPKADTQKPSGTFFASAYLLGHLHPHSASTLGSPTFVSVGQNGAGKESFISMSLIDTGGECCGKN